MAQFRVSVLVNRPVDEVFAYLSDPRRDPEWSGASDEMLQIDPGEPIRSGTRFRQLGSFLGRRLVFLIEVTVYEENHRFGMKVVSGPFRFAGVRTVEAEDGRTRVTFTGGGESRGFFKLAEPLLEKVAARQLKRDLAALKQVLEKRDPSASEDLSGL